MNNENELIFESYRKLIKEGDHADDEIDRGMMSERPFSNSRRDDRSPWRSQRTLSNPSTVKKEPPKEVDDLHFTDWHDEYMSGDGIKGMSTFELMQTAWEEAVKRMIKYAN